MIITKNQNEITNKFLEARQEKFNFKENKVIFLCYTK